MCSLHSEGQSGQSQNKPWYSLHPRPAPGCWLGRWQEAEAGCLSAPSQHSCSCGPQLLLLRALKVPCSAFDSSCLLRVLLSLPCPKQSIAARRAELELAGNGNRRQLHRGRAADAVFRACALQLRVQLQVSDDFSVKSDKSALSCLRCLADHSDAGRKLLALLIIL